MQLVKRCRPCGSNVPATPGFFSRSRQNRDGLDGNCKSCRSKYRKRYYDANCEKAKAEARQWHQDNLQHSRALKRDYVAEHRETGRVRSRQHYQDNKYHYFDNARAYQMRKADAYDEHVDRMVVFARDEGICGICGKEADVDDFHVDHIIPLSRGGRHNYGNVQVSHPPCNLSKQDKILVEEVV